MEEVIRTNIQCFYGAIVRTKYNKYTVNMRKKKIFKNFDTYDEALEYLKTKNYELDLVKNRVYVFTDNPDVLEVHVINKDNPDIFTILDNNENTWKVLNNYTLRYSAGYVKAQKNNTQPLLHHLILDFKYNKLIDNEIDHIDRNPLNNTIKNLRVVSSSVNKINRRRGKNSNTNEKNISWREKDRIYRVNWSENKVKKDKCFTIKEYGSKEEALQRAIEFRNSYIYNLPDYKVSIP